MRCQNTDLIPQYRQQIPKPPKWVILHYSHKRVIWDWFLLLFILYTASAVPFQICFEYESIAMTVIEFLVDTFFFADIVLNFHTSYVGEDGEVITDLKQIRHYYLRTWFVLDLVTSLPYGLLSYVSSSNAVSCRGFEAASSRYRLCSTSKRLILLDLSLSFLVCYLSQI